MSTSEQSELPKRRRFPNPVYYRTEQGRASRQAYRKQYTQLPDVKQRKNTWQREHYQLSKTMTMVPAQDSTIVSLAGGRYLLPCGHEVYRPLHRTGKAIYCFDCKTFSDDIKAACSKRGTRQRT